MFYYTTSGEGKAAAEILQNELLEIDPENKKREKCNKKELEEMEWRVITVWECQLKKCIDEETLEKLYNQITSNIRNMNFIYYSLFIYSLTLSLKVK